MRSSSWPRSREWAAMRLAALAFFRRWVCNLRISSSRRALSWRSRRSCSRAAPPLRLTIDFAVCYALLDDADRSFVDEAVRHAVDESATGSVPFGLPNVASAAVRGGAPLGEGDPSSGYAEMDAAAFFALLDATWGAESSQYLGADRRFVVGKVLRTNTRVLAGGILVCLGLAERVCSSTQRDQM